MFVDQAGHLHHLREREQHFHGGIGNAEALTHPQQLDWEQAIGIEGWGRALQSWYLTDVHVSDSSRSTEGLHVRIANANDYFRRKATEVYNDQGALDLLKSMDQNVVVDISNFDIGELGLPLSKLTAANFCEVGATVIFITDAGRNFIGSLRNHGEM